MTAEYVKLTVEEYAALAVLAAGSEPPAGEEQPEVPEEGLRSLFARDILTFDDGALHVSAEVDEIVRQVQKASRVLNLIRVEADAPGKSARLLVDGDAMIVVEEPLQGVLTLARVDAAAAQESLERIFTVAQVSDGTAGGEPQVMSVPLVPYGDSVRPEFPGDWPSPTLNCIIESDSEGELASALVWVLSGESAWVIENPQDDRRWQARQVQRSELRGGIAALLPG